MPLSLSHDGRNLCSPDWPFADVGTSQSFLSFVRRMKGVIFVLGGLLLFSEICPGALEKRQFPLSWMLFWLSSILMTLVGDSGGALAIH